MREKIMASHLNEQFVTLKCLGSAGFLFYFSLKNQHLAHKIILTKYGKR